MPATTLAPRDAAVAAADEGRRRVRRRRVIGSAISAGALVLLIVTAVVLALGFNNSWWVHHDPKPTSDQVAADGSSLFTQAGIDYFTRTGVLNVTMTSTRPAATELGLASSGTAHLEFLVPLEIRALGTHAIRLYVVDGIDVITSNGRISALEITEQGSYRGLIDQAQEFRPVAGWSAARLAAFESALQASRLKHDGTAHEATIGPVTTAGMRISATLSADAKTDPHLVIRLGAS